MFSANPAKGLQPRAAQMCRVLLGVRLVVALLAVVALGSDLLSVQAVVAFVFAVTTSAVAFSYWRRITRLLYRHPLLLGIDTLVSLLVLTLGGRSGPFLIFTVVTSAIAGLLYRYGGVLYITVLQMICYGTALVLDPAMTGTSGTVLQVFYYPLVGFAALMIRRLLDAADQADEGRRAAEVAAAADRERTRLARDMHDSLAKTVRGIAFAASALPNWVDRDPARAKQEAERIAAATEVASREAREILTELRTGQVDQPLPDAIQQVCAEWTRRTEVPVEVSVTGDIELDVGRRYEAVNVLRESLSNIERHAQATSVTVRLTAEDGRAVLAVSDDGRGFDASAREEFVAAGHYGLLGMTERAKRVGAEITLDSSPDAGTTVTLALPVEQEPARNGRLRLGRPTSTRSEQTVETR